MYSAIGFDLTRPYLDTLVSFKQLISDTINNNPSIDITAPNAGVQICTLAAQATDCPLMRTLCEAVANNTMKLFIGDEGQDGTLLAIECVTFGGSEFNRRGLTNAIEFVDEWSAWFEKHLPESDLHNHVVLFTVLTNLA